MITDEDTPEDTNNNKLSVLDLKTSKEQFLKVNRDGYNVVNPAGYTIICIRKDNINTGLYFNKIDQNNWIFKTYGEDEEVDAYIGSYSNDIEAQETYDDMNRNWYCDISISGHELRVKEDKEKEWRNNQYVKLCSENLNRRVFFNSTSNPLTIDCPGRYNVICIRRGSSNTGLVIISSPFKFCKNDGAVSSDDFNRCTSTNSL